MSDINALLRRSTLIDTSGAEPPRGIQMVAALGGGVYTQSPEDSTDNVFTGRLSLGILGIFVLGAVAFYVWTNGVQGGG